MRRRSLANEPFRARRTMVLAAAVFSILVTATGLEIVARVALNNKEAIRAIRLSLFRGSASLGLLDEYEMQDPRAPANWLLKPGFRKTLGELIADKRRLGKVLAARHLEQTALRLHLDADDVVMRINSDGYKGPDLDKTRSRSRILTIGDSCTFGTMVDYYSYPRTLERTLTTRGFPVEVVNAGVTGYSPRNVALYRLQEFQALQPQIATVYIGWNALYSEDGWPLRLFRPRELLYGWRAFKLIARRLYAMVDPQGSAWGLYAKPKHPDNTDTLLAEIERTQPTFMGDVEAIVTAMTKAGSEVVLLTLPSLFSSRAVPTARALKIGHLPDFTDNPYVLAKMTERYNHALRTLARERGLYLVDLETWANEALVPKDEFFFDAMHLHEAGQQKIGEYLAAEMMPLIDRKERSGGDAGLE